MDRFSIPLYGIVFAALAILSILFIFVPPIFSEADFLTKIIFTFFYALPLAVFCLVYKTIKVSVLDAIVFIIVSTVMAVMFFGGDRFFVEFATPQFMDQYVDTSFHVALINSIVRYGYPSTDLHQGAFSWYHVATHYYDAALVYLTGIDFKAHYALASFAKMIVAIAAVFATIYALDIRSRVGAIFSYILVAIFTASTWLIVESHSQWLAILVGLLCLPIVKRCWHRLDAVGTTLFTAASILTILGKVSLGVPFVFVIGLTLWVRHWTNWRIYLSGAVIFLVFAVNYLALVQAIPTQPPNIRHYLHVKGPGIPLFLTFYALSFYRNGFARAAAPFVTISILIYVFILYVLDLLSDAVYFNLGLWFVTICAIALDLGIRPDQGRDWLRGWVPRKADPVLYNFWVRGAALCVGPLLLASYYTTESVLPRLEKGGARMAGILNNVNPVTQDRIENRIASAANAIDPDAPLFVPRENWLLLYRMDGMEEQRASDYVLKFVSTVDRPLIHGVPAGATHRYNFANYGPNAEWRDILDDGCGGHDDVLILASVRPIEVVEHICAKARGSN